MKPRDGQRTSDRRNVKVKTLRRENNRRNPLSRGLRRNEVKIM